MKDQVGDFLPQLLQLEEGLQTYGILESVRQHPDVWEVVFVEGKGLQVTSNSLLENIDVIYSERQLERASEADTFQYFSDFLHDVHMGGMYFLLTINSYMYLNY